MLDLFFGLKHVVKRKSVVIDSTVFRLHWQISSLLLAACSLLATSRQYVGPPIECMQTGNLSPQLLNTYCWMQSTFTLLYRQETEEAYTGVSNSQTNVKGQMPELKYHTYYQWVCFALFIEAIFFYLPYYLWKQWEGGILRSITNGMELVLMSEEERSHRRSKLNDYLFCHLGLNRIYAYKYIFCEFLCLINVLVQIWYNNWFFDGQFLHYGLEVLRRGGQGLESAMAAAESQPNLYALSKNQIRTIQAVTILANETSPSPKSRLHPMLLMFPRITKCTFHDYGSSGDIQRKNALCLLPMNVLNEKIYLVLWVWYLVLLILLIVVISYRILLLFAVRWRAHCLRSRCPLSNESDLLCICKLGDIGDWFFWYMLAANLEPLMMAEITSEMAHRLAKIRQHQIFKQNNPSLFSRLSSTSSCSIKDFGVGFLKNATAEQHKKILPYDYDVEKASAENHTNVNEESLPGNGNWLNIDQRKLCNPMHSTDSGVSNGSSSKWSWFGCASAPVDPDYDFYVNQGERGKNKPLASFKPMNEPKNKPNKNLEKAFLNHKCQTDTLRRVAQLCGQPLNTTATVNNESRVSEMGLMHSTQQTTQFGYDQERNREHSELRKRRPSLYKRGFIRYERRSLKRKVGKVIAQAIVSPVNSGRTSAASYLPSNGATNLTVVPSSYKLNLPIDKTISVKTAKPIELSCSRLSFPSKAMLTTVKSNTDQLSKNSLKSNYSKKRPK